MSVIARVESLWRYPVKSMRGEELEEAYVGFAGVYGDRLYAFESAASPEGFPYLTGREKEQMLLYRPRFRHGAKAAKPLNWPAAEKLEPGITAVYADADGFAVDIETPDGEVFAIDDPALIRKLGEGIEAKHVLTLLRSDRAFTDCRPVSLFSVQSARQLSEEVGMTVDKRRFRANFYVDLASDVGFGEDSMIGKTLRIGSRVEMTILERDPRCKMITLDPDTAEASPEVLRKVTKAHEGMAGIYGAVLVEGMVRHGDEIVVVR